MGPQVWNFETWFHFTLLVPPIMRCFLDFWKISANLSKCTDVSQPQTDGMNNLHGSKCSVYQCFIIATANFDKHTSGCNSDTLLHSDMQESVLSLSLSYSWNKFDKYTVIQTLILENYEVRMWNKIFPSQQRVKNCMLLTWQQDAFIWYVCHTILGVYRLNC